MSAVDTERASAERASAERASAERASVERVRLVDHFKRAYQIIVGLAITAACTKLFADGTIKFPLDISFWLFCAFFITVVPIFHGGDRSLDVKHLYVQATGFWSRAAYIWDVYILLISAILFVKIAQAIPVTAAAPAQLVPGAAPAAPATPEHFYLWMTILLVFDAAILVVDGAKSKLLGIDLMGTYVKWIALNLALALLCLWAKSPPEYLPSFSVNTTGQIVFAGAFLRTVLDYVFGGDFMFP
jgi:hypothetical protein